MPDLAPAGGRGSTLREMVSGTLMGRWGRGPLLGYPVHGGASDPHRTTPHGRLACYQVWVHAGPCAKPTFSKPAPVWCVCAELGPVLFRARVPACGGRVGVSVESRPQSVSPPVPTPGPRVPLSCPWGCRSVRARVVVRQQHLQQRPGMAAANGLGGRALHAAGARAARPPTAGAAALRSHLRGPLGHG